MRKESAFIRQNSFAVGLGLLLLAFGFVAGRWYWTLAFWLGAALVWGGLIASRFITLSILKGPFGGILLGFYRLVSHNAAGSIFILAAFVICIRSALAGNWGRVGMTLLIPLFVIALTIFFTWSESTRHEKYHTQEKDKRCSLCKRFGTSSGKRRVAAKDVLRSIFGL